LLAACHRPEDLQLLIGKSLRSDGRSAERIEQTLAEPKRREREKGPGNEDGKRKGAEFARTQARCALSIVPAVRTSSGVANDSERRARSLELCKRRGRDRIR
jgi:hypothetical protein